MSPDAATQSDAHHLHPRCETYANSSAGGENYSHAVPARTKHSNAAENFHCQAKGNFNSIDARNE